MTKRINLILIMVGVLLLLLLSVTRANADYTGPDRKVYSTSWQRNRCTYVAQRSGFSDTCTLNLYCYPFDSCPAADQTYGFFNGTVCSGWETCTAGTCSVAGPTVNLEGCSEGEEGCALNTTTSHLPPATISGVLDGCNASNGWCTGSPTLTLTSAEPLPAEQIIGLEGSYNGQPFAFAATTGSLNFDEGTADLSYWALSSYGDSSLMGTQTVRVDTQAPGIDASLSGTPGNNGWMISAATLTVNGVDPSPGSGIAAYQITVNGVAQPSNSISLIDGVHAFSAVAVDAAGWQSDPLTGDVKIDTQPPTVAVVMQAGERVDGWYTTPVSLIASGSDGGSGIAGYQASLNNGAWVTFNGAFVVKNGEHTVAIRAVDVAGNVSEAWLSPVLRVNSTEALVYPELMFPHGSPVQGNNTAGVVTAAEVPLVAEASAETTQPQVISFSNPPKQVGKSGVTASVKTSPGILWGALGASAIAGGAVMLAAAKRKEREEEQAKQKVLAAQAAAMKAGILSERKAKQKAAQRAAAAKAAEEAAQKAAIVSPDPKLQGQEAAWLAGKIEKDKKTKPKGAPKPPAPGVHAQTPPPYGIGTQNQEDMCLNPQAGQGINWGVFSLPIIGPKPHTVIKATATPTLTPTATPTLMPAPYWMCIANGYHCDRGMEFAMKNNLLEFEILKRDFERQLIEPNSILTKGYLSSVEYFSALFSGPNYPIKNDVIPNMSNHTFNKGDCANWVSRILNEIGIDISKYTNEASDFVPVIRTTDLMTVLQGNDFKWEPTLLDTKKRYSESEVAQCVIAFDNPKLGVAIDHVGYVLGIDYKTGSIVYSDHSSTPFYDTVMSYEISEIENNPDLLKLVGSEKFLDKELERLAGYTITLYCPSTTTGTITPAP